MPNSESEIENTAKAGLGFAIKKGVNLLTSAIVNTLAPGIGEAAKQLIQKVGGAVLKKIVEAPGFLSQKLSSLSGTEEKKEDKSWLIALGIAILIPMLTLFAIIAIVVAFVTKIVSTTTTTFRRSSEFIDLTKVANPSLIPNDKLSTTAITYSVTISAKSKKLSNIKILQDEYRLYPRSSRSSIVTPTHQLPSNLPSIEPNNSFPFSYEIKLLNPNIKDSLLVNSLIIEANVQDSLVPKRVKATAVVAIGDVNQCFYFSDDRDPWEEDEKIAELQIINQLMQRQNYQNLLCGNPVQPIRLLRDKVSLTGYCEVDYRNSSIVLTQKCLGTQANRFYSLAHESGHFFTNRNQDIYEDFKKEVMPGGQIATEGYLCSYPLAKIIGEDFPETIAVYMTTQEYPEREYGKCPEKQMPDGTKKRFIDLINDYPIHWRFASSGIFD